MVTKVSLDKDAEQFRLNENSSATGGVASKWSP